MPTRPFLSVLAATDLTESSDGVVEGAGRIAERVGAELHLVHAFDLGALPPEREPPAGMGFPQRVDFSLRELRAQARRTVGDSPVLATMDVVIRTPFLAITERAAEVGADLIVLGANAGWKGEVLGGTAEKVLRHAKVPCLVLRSPLELPISRILAPQDLADPAPAALDLALAWATGLRVEHRSGVPDVLVEVVHVLSPPPDSPPLPFEQAAVGPEPAPFIGAAVDRLGASEVEVREELVWGDDPASEIARFAARSGSDLVVMGTHGHGAVLRAVLGSVAAGVIAASQAPILLVPPRAVTGEARDDEAGAMASLAG